MSLTTPQLVSRMAVAPLTWARIPSAWTINKMRFREVHRPSESKLSETNSKNYWRWIHPQSLNLATSLQRLSYPQHLCLSLSIIHSWKAKLTKFHCQYITVLKKWLPGNPDLSQLKMRYWEDFQVGNHQLSKLKLAQTVSPYHQWLRVSSLERLYSQPSVTWETWSPRMVKINSVNSKC